jgi:hypothetical protein
VALAVFLKQHPSAAPLQFLLFQLMKAEGRRIVEKLFRRLISMTAYAAMDLAEETHKALLPMLKKHGSRVLLAIDEMEGAAKIDTQYLSRTGKSGRGLLSPFLQAAGDLQGPFPVSLLVCGTGSSQERYETVTSDIGKQTIHTIRADGFPLATETSVEHILGSILGVTKEMIHRLPQLDYLLNARYRLAARAVEIFMESTEDEIQSRLLAAVDTSVMQHKERLLASLNEKLNGPLKKDRQHYLNEIHVVYVASKLTNGRMNFATTDLDLCRIGLGALVEKDVFRVSEKFALEVIEDYFARTPSSDASISFQSSVRDLETVVLARGEAVTAKGELFENVVFQAFRRPCFQNKPVTELPFISALSDADAERRKNQEWAGVVFNCTRVMALAHDSTDPRFAIDNPLVLFSPEESHRTDGVMTFDKSHELMLGIKFYTQNVPSDLVESQFRATDPNKVYGLAKLDQLNERFTKLRTEWDSLGLNKRKALRVHVNIPGSAIPREAKKRVAHVFNPGTYFLDDGSIVVNLDMSNIELLLGKPQSDEEKNVFEALMRLLVFVNPAC